MKKHKKAFTLIEIIIGILIFSMMIIIGFQTLGAIGVGKIKLMEKTDIVKESYYLSEKLFESIKQGGSLDYEEYFNRKVVGNTTTLNGHYNLETGFGNFGKDYDKTVNPINYGNNLYVCGSKDLKYMGKEKKLGCYNNDYAYSKPTLLSTTYTNLDLSGDSSPQRYGQYKLQFTDFNSNGDDNWNDDADDEAIPGPEAFKRGNDIKELYLISGDKTKRTIYRWNWKTDPNAPTGKTCDINTNSIGEGCLGYIEFLKLEGRDWGFNHIKSGEGYLDNQIDTWIINKNFTGNFTTDIIAGSKEDTGFWQPLFPDNMSVVDFKVFAYPNINSEYEKTTNQDLVNPYIRIQLSLTPSWKKRGAMKGKVPVIDINTTINLSDYFSK